MTLQEESAIFKQALIDFLVVCAEETHIVELLNFLEDKLKEYFEQ